MKDLKALKTETEDVLLNAYAQEDAIGYILEAINMEADTNTQYRIYEYFVNNFGYIEE